MDAASIIACQLAAALVVRCLTGAALVIRSKHSLSTDAHIITCWALHASTVCSLSSFIFQLEVAVLKRLFAGLQILTRLSMSMLGATPSWLSCSWDKPKLLYCELVDIYSPAGFLYVVVGDSNMYHWHFATLQAML